MEALTFLECIADYTTLAQLSAQMGMPGPAGPGSCFRFSDTINLRVADAILSRAQRNNVVVHHLSSCLLKLNLGVDGARRIAVEAQMLAQRTGNATHSRIHVSIYI